jgi:polyribonucleotide nucleotidyltransferase
MSFDKPGLIEHNHNSEKFHTVTVKCGNADMVFETGRVAKQTSGGVVITWGDSRVLVTECHANKPREFASFLPLTVEYLEKTYAAGRIPGGFFKREARPRDYEILNARVTDRSIRPLFADGYRNEIQVITTVMSHDGEHGTDVMSLCGASMALSIGSAPWAAESGPLAGVRVARVGGELVAFPTHAQRDEADIDLIVAVSKDAIVMVEGGADEAEEKDLVEALFFAHDAGQPIIAAIHEMREHMGKPKDEHKVPEVDADLKKDVHAVALEKGIKDAIATRNKIQRYAKLDAVKADVKAHFEEKLGDDWDAKKGMVSEYYGAAKSHIIRRATIEEKTRLDGRKYDEIRNIDNEVGILQRAHGSALFTRGETQAIVSTTLGTRDDEQKIDNLLGVEFRKFMLHYNFPPFCVGEARFLRGTSRRELGHGALAQRAVEGVVPNDEETFPYTVRVVSEITESNGSSSMASVCGATMSMLDAGVPLKAPVAGIAMGLIWEEDGYAVLSDILGDEDHLGDMDFKVCGTPNGVTAIQMDIKIDGLTKEVMQKALEQAKAGRLHILDEMAKGISTPREEMSEWAPRITTMKINPDKIRDIIGPGGKTIRDIVAKTGAKIDVTDDGIVRIAAVGAESGKAAMTIIEDLTREAEVNRIYKGLVRKTVDFGAFVELFPGTDGLCHISELADKRVNQVTDVVQEGDEVLVKVLSIDRDGKIRLSRRQAKGHEAGEIVVGE